MDIVERLRNLVQPGAECCPDSERLTALIHAGFDAANEIERLRKDNLIVRNSGVAIFFALREMQGNLEAIIDRLDWALSYDRDGRYEENPKPPA